MQYSFLYVFFTALSVIIIHNIGNKMPDLLMIFLSTAFALAFFNLINLRKIKITYQIMLKNKKDFFYINALILVNWSGTFLIPIYFSPSAFLIYIFAILTFLGSVDLYLKNKHTPLLIKSVALFIFLISYSVVYYNTYPKNYFIFFAGASFTGVGIYMYSKATEKVKVLNLSATEILALRFWLLLVFSFIAVVYNNELGAITLVNLVDTGVIAFVSLIVPIYFSQKSIEKAGAAKSSVIYGFTPATIAVMEHFAFKSDMDANFVFALLLQGIIALYFIYSIYHSNLSNRNSGKG